MPELVTSPQTTQPVDTPPLVAVKVRPRLSQSSGPRTPPVDTSPTVVKFPFPALAVLLMVRVLPVIPVAELSRPTLAAPGRDGRGGRS